MNSSKFSQIIEKTNKIIVFLDNNRELFDNEGSHQRFTGLAQNIIFFIREYENNCRTMNGYTLSIFVRDNMETLNGVVTFLMERKLDRSA